MDRLELEKVLKQQAFRHGGTREACVKVQDFMINFYKWGYENKYGKDKMEFPKSCVTVEEFIDALDVLVASTFLKKDEVPKVWRCNPEKCKFSDTDFCYGMFNLTLDTTVTNVCPFCKAVDQD